jgi:hypothetical protein
MDMKFKDVPKDKNSTGEQWITRWGPATEENRAVRCQESLGDGVYALPITDVYVIRYKDGLSVEISVPLIEPAGKIKFLTVGKSTVEDARFVQLFGREVYETLLTLELNKRYQLEGAGRIAWRWADRKETGELYFEQLDTDCEVRLRLFAAVGGLLPSSKVRAWAPVPKAAPAATPRPLPTLAPLTPQPPKLGVPEAPAPTPAALDNL